MGTGPVVTGSVPGLRFRVLGPVQVLAGDRDVTPGSPNQVRLLAVLLARRGETVRADTLIDALWGDRPPRTAGHTLNGYLSRLRGILGARLVSAPEGYQLRCADLDADDFQAALGLGGPARVAELVAALDLWRGPAFGTCAELATVRPVATALDQARTGARESLARALLEGGEPARAVAVAEELVAELPHHEGGWEVLVRGLAAAHRAADALDTFHRARRSLAELGLEPSRSLRAAQADVLAGGTTAAAGQLPAAVTSRPGRLRGRDDDLAAVGGLLTDANLVTVVGPGGVGKTRLATEVARATSSRYGSGWRMVQLAAVTEPGAVADAVAAGLGLTGSLAGASNLDLLAVLDNCEHLIDEVAAVVQQLLPPGRPARLRILTTSRERLGLPGERAWPLDPLALAGDPPPARQLFLDRAEAVRPGSVRAGDVGIVDRIVGRVDGLPLAIEMAAARLATTGPAELAEFLEHEPREVGSPGSRGEARHRTLGALIEWSAALLDGPERDALNRWPVFAGAVSAPEAAAVLDVSPDLTRALAARSLLAVETPRPDGDPVRFRMLQTVRSSLPGPTGSDRARHAGFFAELAAEADSGLRGPAEARAHQRLTAALDELRSAHTWARSADPRLGARISRSLHHFAVQRLHEQVLGWAARLAPRLRADDPATATVHASTGYRCTLAGDLRTARWRAGKALELAGDDLAVRLQAHDCLGDVDLFEGKLDAAAQRGVVMLQLAREAGDGHYVAMGHTLRALSLSYAGRPAEADAALADRTGLELITAPSSHGWLVYCRGEVLLERDPQAAAEALGRAVELADSVGNRYLGGVARVSVTSVLARSGDPDQALREFGEILRHWLDLASLAHLLTTLRNLVVLLCRLGLDDAAAQLWGTVSPAVMSPSFGAELRRLDEARATLERRLGSGRFSAQASIGRTRGVEAAARAVLPELVPH